LIAEKAAEAVAIAEMGSISILSCCR